MPDENLVAEFRRTRDQWDAIGLALAPLAEQLAVEAVADVLPGAAVLEVRGETNEDRLRTLRIRRVLSVEADVLFDVAVGHDDRHVEDAIDEAHAEYLDLLLDLTGDRYMGSHTIRSALHRF